MPDNAQATNVANTATVFVIEYNIVFTFRMVQMVSTALEFTAHGDSAAYAGNIGKHNPHQQEASLQP